MWACHSRSLGPVWEGSFLGRAHPGWARWAGAEAAKEGEVRGYPESPGMCGTQGLPGSPGQGSRLEGPER